jgi:hypothetical protein
LGLKPAVGEKEGDSKGVDGVEYKTHRINGSKELSFSFFERSPGTIIQSAEGEAQDNQYNQ